MAWNDYVIWVLSRPKWPSKASDESPEYFSKQRPNSEQQYILIYFTLRQVWQTTFCQSVSFIIISCNNGQCYLYMWNIRKGYVFVQFPKIALDQGATIAGELKNQSKNKCFNVTVEIIYFCDTVVKNFAWKEYSTIT